MFAQDDDDESNKDKAHHIIENNANERRIRNVREQNLELPVQWVRRRALEKSNQTLTCCCCRAKPIRLNGMPVGYSHEWPSHRHVFHIVMLSPSTAAARPLSCCHCTVSRRISPIGTILYIISTVIASPETRFACLLAGSFLCHSHMQTSVTIPIRTHDTYKLRGMVRCYSLNTRHCATGHMAATCVCQPALLAH